MKEPRHLLKKHRDLAILIALLAVSLTALTLSSKPLTKSVQRGGFTVFTAVQKQIAEVKFFFKETFTSIAELKRLQDAYDELQTKLEDSQAVQDDMEQLKKENHRLRRQLRFSRSLDFEHVSAQIIAKEPGNLFSPIVLNKGERDGVEQDMPVIAYQDEHVGLVGKIISVTPGTAIMQPLYDPSAFVASRLLTSRYEGLVQGSGISSEELRMLYIKKMARENIQFGDLVVTSGLSDDYPPGIGIGRVEEISAREWETSLTLRITPLIDFTRLEYLFILKEKG